MASLEQPRGSIVTDPGLGMTTPGGQPQDTTEIEKIQQIEELREELKQMTIERDKLTEIKLPA